MSSAAACMRRVYETVWNQYGAVALHTRLGPTAARYTSPTAEDEMLLAPASMIT